MKNKKIISVSLWGNKEIYNKGLISNHKLLNTIYKDWSLVVYYDDKITKESKDYINNNNIESYDMTNSNIDGMMWRFLISDKYENGYVIFRDCDSRISLREELAVKEWIDSGKTIHVMRDHPYHQIPYGNNSLGILGGMWGIKLGQLNIRELIDKFMLEDKEGSVGYGCDQKFLKEIYNKFINDKFVHDEFFEGNRFPIKRDDYHFVGERIDEYESPVGTDYLILKQIIG